MDYTDLFTASHHNAGSEVQLIGMDGSPVDMYLTILGVDSKKWRTEKAAMERQAVINLSLPDGERVELDPSDAVATALANCVTGWRGFTIKGKKIKFDNEKVKQLFIEAPYIIDHVDRFFSNRANFTKGKAKK